MARISVALVIGTRPNIVKAAPVYRALRKIGGLEPILVHSGQHFDASLSQNVIRDVGLPEPDVRCTTGAPRRWNPEHFARQFAAFLRDRRPAIVMVFGDVDTTRVAAEVARQRGLPLVHVEAGLRSFDDRMPEEANRIRTDALADLLFVTEEAGMRHIQREGLSGRAALVGNTMIDSLIFLRDRIEARAAAIGPRPPTVVVTLHRRETIRDRNTLSLLLSQLTECAREYRVHWPLHPHARIMIDRFGLAGRLAAFDPRGPDGYVDFLAAVKTAHAVITDSGGVQEETTFLGVPCFTVRASTERPVTIERGTNVLVPPSSLGDKPLLAHLRGASAVRCELPPLWDGRAAERIAALTAEYCGMLPARSRTI